MSSLDICNDGDRHQWRPDSGSPDGMVCAGCGVSEAELDHLEAVADARRTEEEM